MRIAGITHVYRQKIKIEFTHILFDKTNLVSSFTCSKTFEWRLQSRLDVAIKMQIELFLKSCSHTRRHVFKLLY